MVILDLHNNITAKLRSSGNTESPLIPFFITNYQTYKSIRKFPDLTQFSQPFSACFKNAREVIFLKAAGYHLQIPLDVRHCFRTLFLNFYFQFGKQSETVWGQAKQVGWMGNNNHILVNYKLCGFQGWVSGHTVMMEPVMVAPKAPIFFDEHSLAGPRIVKRRSLLMCSQMLSTFSVVSLISGLPECLSSSNEFQPPLNCYRVVQ